jgi:glycine oxidase
VAVLDGETEGRWCAPPVYFHQHGTLVVAHAPDRASLEHFTRLLHHKLPEACRAQAHKLDSASLAQHESALAGRFGSGVFLEGEGQLANDQLMAASNGQDANDGQRQGS